MGQRGLGRRDEDLEMQRFSWIMGRPCVARKNPSGRGRQGVREEEMGPTEGWSEARERPAWGPDLKERGGGRSQGMPGASSHRRGKERHSPLHSRGHTACGHRDFVGKTCVRFMTCRNVRY